MLSFLYNQKENRIKNHNPCLHCLLHSTKKLNFKSFYGKNNSIFLIVFLKKVDFPFDFPFSIFNVWNYYSKNFSIGIFKTCFICYYCPEAIMKKFLQLKCIAKVLDDGSIFSGTTRRQERSSFYWIFINSFFKRYTAIEM